MDEPSDSLIARRVREARSAIASLESRKDDLDRIAHAGGLLVRCFRGGGRVLVCGNGGSACDAMHFAEELTGRFRADRPPLPAMALLDPAHLTCVANDFGFEHVFSRMIEAHGREGDCLVVLSTSGNSPNILRAIHAARARAMTVLALLGRDGGQSRGLAQCEWVIPERPSERIQEVHMLIMHTLVELIEREMFGDHAC